MPTSGQDSSAAEFRLKNFLPYRLVAVADSIFRIFAENYEENFNLTMPEWRVLAVVAENGTMSPTEVGNLTAMDKVKVSRAAQGLTAKGMLRRSRDPHDGRGRLLRLTRKGSAIHGSVVPLATRLEAELFNDLSAAELSALNRVLAKVTTRIETNRGTPGQAASE